MRWRGLVLLALGSLVLGGGCVTKVDRGRGAVIVAGELKQWHTVTLTFDGPEVDEAGENHPFLDYRMEVTFTKDDHRYVVPGYYAADGDAGQTGATSGNKWRVHFLPVEPGIWTYRASFRIGQGIAVDSNAVDRPPVTAASRGRGRPSYGEGVDFDGTTGTIAIGPTDKTGRDFRGQGLLRYTGHRYLQFAHTGTYFLKGGADSPENFLAYEDFDQTFDTAELTRSGEAAGEKFIHRYQPHVEDWRPGDPTWRGEKGKGIVGALNYLAAKGMNSVYFLTYNLDGGDGRDTWMWTGPNVRDRFDVSKLDQWNLVFDHMDRLGLMLHVVTQETENDRRLGGSPGLNPVRMLYYRELVARFAHHPGLVWNLGEENNTSDADRKAIARYIRALDPYRHPITVHTYAGKALSYYNGILGDPSFEATSIQGSLDQCNREAIELRRRSAAAGRKWVIFADEQNPSTHGVLPDADDPNHDQPRRQALWGNLMGGGAGVEWYFGNKFPHMDINCEDWRSRDRMRDQTRYALEFFRRHLPFWEMEPDNSLAAGADARVLAKPGSVYAVHLPKGGAVTLNLPGGAFEVRWYNPRAGGALQNGSVRSVKGSGAVSLGSPPSGPEQDWAVLVTRR